MNNADPTQAFYNNHAAEYEANTSHLSSLEWRDTFLSKVKAGGRILDVGCAYGRDSAYFMEKGFSVVGIDYAEAMIERARARVSGALFLCQDVRHLNVEGPFDGIYADSVFLHVPKIEIPDALKQFPPLLTSDAPVFIAMKAGSGEGLEKDPRYADALKYYSYFTRDELAAVLTESGLIVDELEEWTSPFAYQKTKLLKGLAHKA